MLPTPWLLPKIMIVSNICFSSKLANVGLLRKSSILCPCTVVITLTPAAKASANACTSSAEPISSVAKTSGAMERISILMPIAFGHPSKISTLEPKFK